MYAHSHEARVALTALATILSEFSIKKSRNETAEALVQTEIN